MSLNLLNHAPEADDCVLLGVVGDCDLWYAPQNGDPTLVIRWGSEGGEYDSFNLGMFGDYYLSDNNGDSRHRYTQVALNLAIERGLVSDVILGEMVKDRLRYQTKHLQFSLKEEEVETMLDGKPLSMMHRLLNPITPNAANKKENK